MVVGNSFPLQGCTSSPPPSPPALKMKEEVEGKWIASGAARGAQWREQDKAVRVLWPGEGVPGGGSKSGLLQCGRQQMGEPVHARYTGLTGTKMVLSG